MVWLGLLEIASRPNRAIDTTPNLSAAIISPMVDASAATGSSETCATHPADHGVGKAAGKWTDAATAEHGDLLDVIRQSCGLVEFGDVLAEAHRFLSLPRPERGADSASPIAPAPVGSPESARRLFAMSKPIHGTIAETYLRTRGISALHETLSLRFHLRCYYKPATSRRRCRHSRDHDRHVTLAHGGDRGGAHPHTVFSRRSWRGDNAPRAALLLAAQWRGGRRQK